MNILFFSRLGLYLLALVIPVIHPAVVVPYDLNGWLLWFLVIPAQMLIAKYLVPPRVNVRTTAVASGAVFLITFLISSGGSMVLLLLGGGVLAFILTLLVFNTATLGRNIAIFEQFFIAFIYYKLLNFSRASEEIARASSGITQVLLVLIVCSFLLHSVILYFAAFRVHSRKRSRREVALLGGIAPVLLVLALVLPPDFVEHSVVFNPVDEDIAQPYNQYDGKGWPDDSGGSTRREGEEGEDGENGEEGELQGIPSDKWSERLSRRGAKGKQYAVMLVVSSLDPVYSAEAYYSKLDPEKGFLYDNEEALNNLTYKRLLETWKDNDPAEDKKREPKDVRYFSTLSDRVLQYRPYRIEPTVLNMEYHPFDYRYHAVSMVSVAKPDDFRTVEKLPAETKQEMQKYLDVPLSSEDRQVFREYLDDVIPDDSGYYERIRAILESFSSFHYELGFDDSVAVDKLITFLTEVKRGDCTEFSNTTAVLTRMAGIPSRVVTGYLASRNLQTPAHKQGVMELRRVIPPLKEYPLQDITLVTTAHHHSWVQLYMPGYGWVDVETTSEAIPPPPGANPNSRNVVIPMIQDVRSEDEAFVFPWKFVLKVFLIAALIVITALYLYRYGKEVYLSYRSRRNDQKGLRALFTLLLMRKAADGYEIKHPHVTALEYAELHAELAGFAHYYTTLRYKEKFTPGEEESLWRNLRQRYREALSEKRDGFFPFLRRIFNLKGLYY